MTFAEFLRTRFGENWVLAPRMTDRLRDRGYCRAVTQREYAAAQLEWAKGMAAEDPSIEAASRVLRDPHKREAAEVLLRQGVV